VPTADGAPLARWDTWIGLLLTFIEGEPAGHDPSTLERLGGQAGLLHTTPVEGDLAPSPKGAPSAAVRLRQLEQLESAGPVPECARSFHQAALEVWQGLADLDQLPQCLLHGDCWPGNAIRTPAGDVVLIDWESAGRGHAILELAYLLLATTSLSSAGGLVVNHAGIEAVARGYRRRRRLDERELAWLLNAVRFDLVRRALQMNAFTLDAAGWAGNEWPSKLLARRAICDQVAEVAARSLSRA
jgi:Ser/Thr protein kinase RdoA (MazF antagonist)